MKRVQKPIRLYVLTIFIVVAYGAFPFVSTFPFSGGFMLFQGFWNLPLNGSIIVLYGADGSAPFLLVLVSLFLCVFSAAAAIWAFYGFAEGRTATLIFVTLDVLWWTLLVVVGITHGDLDASGKIRLAIEPVPPIGWLIFVWWNFMRPEMTEYYKYCSTLNDG